MERNEVSYRITIVMLSVLLIFSGLMLANNWAVRKARGDPAFGTVNFSTPETGGSGFWISANITNMETDPGDKVSFNFTINTSTSETHYRQWPVTNDTGTSWKITVNIPIPIDALKIKYDFNATNSTDSTFKTKNGEINVLDSIAPTVPAESNINSKTGELVEFNASGCTDNINAPDELGYHWSFNYGSLKNQSGMTSSFTFDIPGTYPVTLYVNDVAMNFASKTFDVNVQEADMAPVLFTGVAAYVDTVKMLTEDANATNISLQDNGTEANYIFNYTGPSWIGFNVSTQADWNVTGNWSTTYTSDNVMGEIVDVNDTKIFQITPNPDVYFPAGVTENVTLIATTSMGSKEYNISFGIASVNDAPEISDPILDTITIKEGSNQTIIVVAKDTKDMNDVLTLLTDNITTEIPGITAAVVNTTVVNTTNTYTFKLNLTATNDMAGSYNISLNVIDDDADSDVQVPLTASKNITLKIDNTNDAPSFDTFMIGTTAGTDADGEILFKVNEDKQVNITITAADLDLIHDDVLTFDIEKKDANAVATITKVSDDTANLTFKGKDNFDKETWVNVSLEDGKGLIVYQMIKINLTPVNDPPEIDNMGIKLVHGELDEKTMLYNFTLNHTADNKQVAANEITDLDGDAVTYSWFVISDLNGSATLPANKTADRTGINFTFSFPMHGNYSIWLRVSDGKGGTDEKRLLGPITIPEYIPPKDDEEASSMTLILAIVIIVLLAIVIIVVMMMIKKKKGEEPEEDEFAELGMPPDQSGGMDQFGQPQQQPGMDQFGQPQQQPGMDQFGQPQQPQPGFGQPQQPQPGFGQPQQPQPGFGQPAAPMGGGNTCPHCHSPIEPGWFLCPNCKNQL